MVGRKSTKNHEWQSSGLGRRRGRHRSMAVEAPTDETAPPPLVISLNCIDDCSMEQVALAGIAAVEHVSLSQLTDGRIDAAAVVLLHSLAYLPRAAQRRLRHSQLILCLGSSDRSVDSALALDLGLRLLHIDTSRAEEIADTIMALFLGLLRRTHLLSHHSLSASGWLGSIQPLCRGMRRCRGLVLGIIGWSASATSLATRSLAFSMTVLYFEVDEGEGKTKRLYPRFPSLARKMDTLNDLLAASDLISLHCALTNETVQILNFECLQHVKPGTFLVNTCSSQLLDDCAVKQLLIDGTLAGCALDGAEGPQWMEAWVKEMPNVLILPRSADYSEEVWMEIREKTVSVLKSFFIDDIFPLNAVSDDEDIDGNGREDSSTENDEHGDKLVGSRELSSSSVHDLIDGIEVNQECQQRGNVHLKSESRFQAQSDSKCDRSSKKAKRKHGRHKPLHGSYEPLEPEKGSTSHQEDDTVMSSTDQMLSSTTFFASTGHSRNQKPITESVEESISERLLRSNKGINRQCGDLLKDGFVVALVARDRHALHVSRQRQGGGWFLDTLSNVTRRDPAAQFLIVFSNKDTFGFRSLAAGGKLLQVNRRGEFVFASYSFDAGEGWILEGSLSHCSIVNCRNHLAILEVQILVLATVEEDGVTRWLESFDEEDSKLLYLT